jgi:hypothetical protein
VAAFEDGALAGTAGFGALPPPPDLPDATASAGCGDVDELLDDVPSAVLDLGTAGPAVLGWTDGCGRAVALPATWDPDTCRATVPAAVFDSVGAPRASRASVTRDEWTGFGPSGKQGLMLRGDARASDGDGEVAVDLDVAGVTYWDGVETGQVRHEAT